MYNREKGKYKDHNLHAIADKEFIPHPLISALITASLLTLIVLLLLCFKIEANSYVSLVM